MRPYFTPLVSTVIAIAMGIVVPILTYTAYEKIIPERSANVITATQFARGGVLKDINIPGKRLTIEGRTQNDQNQTSLLSMQFTDTTTFLRHTPVKDGDIWVGIESTSITPADLLQEEYVYVEYSLDWRDEYLAKTVIVGNTLIQ